MLRATKNTKEKLIETAVDLIWRSSYGSVSVDDICRTANVHKGSFYHYFSSKIDLTLAALDAVHEASKPVFDDIFDPIHPPKQRFKLLCSLAYEKQKETRKKYGRVCGCPFMSLGSELCGLDDAIQEKVSKTFDHHVLYYQTAIKDMMRLGELPKTTDPKKKAEQIYAYLMGHIMMARIRNDAEFLKENLTTGVFNILGISEKETETV